MGECRFDPKEQTADRMAVRKITAIIFAAKETLSRLQLNLTLMP
jgi:hypothetical protein